MIVLADRLRKASFSASAMMTAKAQAIAETRQRGAAYGMSPCSRIHCATDADSLRENYGRIADFCRALPPRAERR